MFSIVCVLCLHDCVLRSGHCLCLCVCCADWEGLLPTPEQCVERLEAMGDLWLQHTADSAGIQGQCQYTTTDGAAASIPRQFALHHIFNHGTHHRYATRTEQLVQKLSEVLSLYSLCLTDCLLALAGYVSVCNHCLVGVKFQ